MEISKKSQNLNGRDNIVSNQAADNNAPVIQNSNITTNNFGIDTQTLQFMFGMSEEKIRAEFDLKLEERIKKLTDEIKNKLSNNSIEQIPVDPSIIAFYKKLHFQAACSSSDLDIEILSELLVNRLKSNENREDTLAIEKAAEIINHVKEEDLVALCVYVYMNYLTVEKKSIEEGLKEFMVMIKNIKGNSKIPSDGKWIENLGIVNAIRIIDSHNGPLSTYSVSLKNAFSKYDKKIVTPKYVTESLSNNDLFQEIKQLLERMKRQLLLVTPIGFVLTNAFLKIRMPEFGDINMRY